MQLSPAAPLIGAVHHVAIVTHDLDRFRGICCRELGPKVVFFEETSTLRHAIPRGGLLSWLHPVESPGNGHGKTSAGQSTTSALRHFHATTRRPPVGTPFVSIQRLTDFACWPEADGLLREYVWVAKRLAEVHAFHLDGTLIEQRHASFARDTVPLLAGPGRLLPARVHGEPVSRDPRLDARGSGQPQLGLPPAVL